MRFPSLSLPPPSGGKDYPSDHDGVCAILNMSYNSTRTRTQREFPRATDNTFELGYHWETSGADGGGPLDDRILAVEDESRHQKVRRSRRRARS